MAHGSSLEGEAPSPQQRWTYEEAAEWLVGSIDAEPAAGRAFLGEAEWPGGFSDRVARIRHLLVERAIGGTLKWWGRFASEEAPADRSHPLRSIPREDWKHWRTRYDDLYCDKDGRWYHICIHRNDVEKLWREGSVHGVALRRGGRGAEPKYEGEEFWRLVACLLLERSQRQLGQGEFVRLVEDAVQFLGWPETPSESTLRTKHRELVKVQRALQSARRQAGVGSTSD